MSALLALAAAGFRRYSRYRMATAAGALTNTVFGLLKASITLAAIAAAGGSLGGYDAGAGSTYAWLTQALVAPIAVFVWNDLALRVRSGDIAVDLGRPVDLQLSWLAADLGRACYVLLPRGLPPLLMGAVTFGLVLPTTPLPYLVGLVSTVLAVSVSFACRFLVNLVAFWLVEVRGVILLYQVVSSLLIGLYVPVYWFPGWLRAIAGASPFPSMLQTPVDVFTARTSGPAAGVALGVQLAWLLAVLAVGRLVLRVATRKLVVQGG